jgi:hypothetical protein
LKKRTKKLLFVWLQPFRMQRAQTGKSFLVLFFKKEPLLLPEQISGLGTNPAPSALPAATGGKLPPGA